METMLFLEVVKFRYALELATASNEDIPWLISDEFPVNNCKLASTLLCKHLFSVSEINEIVGVHGEIYDEDSFGVSHYWLEVRDFIIDITADQYNTLDVSKRITRNRPYPPTLVTGKKNSYLHKCFNGFDKEIIHKGFPSFGHDAVFDIETSYSIIMSLVKGGEK